MPGYGPAMSLARVSLLVALVLTVTAPSAGATIRVQSHNDPAGDATAIAYRLSSPSWTQPISFTLHDGADRSFGPKPGTYTVQALPPAGWRVSDIQCSSLLNPGSFTIDVAHGIVTMAHITGDEQTCSFTNSNVGAGPPSSGVAPSPPAEELPKKKKIGLLGVRVGKGFVKVRVRIIHRSTIRLHLRRGTRVLARKRVVRPAGVRVVKVRLRDATRRWFRDHGRKRALFTLKTHIADRRGGRKVFWYRALVPM
jgi:hypothetical protein